MAYEFYVTIEGSKSGFIRGDVAKRGYEGRIAGLALDYEVMSGQSHNASDPATGKHQHSPITITKRWDTATPQLFQALVTEEVLKSVVIEFEQVTPQVGKNFTYHTVKLTNAFITHIHQHATAETGELEDVSIVFQKIEIENKISKMTVADDVKK